MRHRRTSSNNPPYAGLSQELSVSGKVRTMICGLQSFFRWVLQESHCMCNLGSITSLVTKVQAPLGCGGQFSWDATHLGVNVGVLLQAYSVSEGFATYFTSKGPDPTVRPSYMDLQAVGSGEHLKNKMPLIFPGGSFVFTSVYSSYSLFDSSLSQAV